ncbi:MAG: 4Fe-4S dicluster domain-containing protein [Ruminococcaceae bacterium]|nr:4Fe-4S dicluster domain-containing protein [Oscillospiraceae bacterium]
MENIFNTTKKLGLGLMRLPMTDGVPEYDKISEMIDALMAEGFNYFDTAHGYMGGTSETVAKKCLSEKYDRNSFVLTNKLSTFHFTQHEEIRPLFYQQLEACGVDYFDFYLMHAQDKEIFEKYKKCRAYETALELKEEGKIKHLGISFHDKPDVLRQILTEYPQIEVVQIQLNYADYDNPAVESYGVYKVCREFNKPIIVMEPVKGGCLASLPSKADAIFRKLGDASAASYAIRYAASFEGVEMVLSGMGNMDMVKDNMQFMNHFSPLSAKEQEAIDEVREVFASQNLIPCTACEYCLEVCPAKIPIPGHFSSLNNHKAFESPNAKLYYEMRIKKGGKASDCIKCGKCEKICPQHLKIRSLLEDVANAFEN